MTEGNGRPGEGKDARRDEKGPTKAPADIRPIRKGRSGNPRGRPRGAKQPISGLDDVIDTTLTVTTGGVTEEMTVDEALQHRTFEQAIAGNRTAQRQVLKMIEKREKWLSDHGEKRSPEIRLLLEPHDLRMPTKPSCC